MPRYHPTDVRHKDHPDHQRYLDGEFDSDEDDGFEEDHHSFSQRRTYDDGRLMGRITQRSSVCVELFSFASSQPAGGPPHRVSLSVTPHDRGLDC